MQVIYPYYPNRNGLVGSYELFTEMSNPPPEETWFDYPVCISIKEAAELCRERGEDHLYKIYTYAEQILPFVVEIEELYDRLRELQRETNIIGAKLAKYLEEIEVYRRDVLEGGAS